MNTITNLFIAHPMLFALAASFCALGMLGVLCCILAGWADEVEERPDLHVVRKDAK